MIHYRSRCVLCCAAVALFCMLGCSSNSDSAKSGSAKSGSAKPATKPAAKSEAKPAAKTDTKAEMAKADAATSGSDKDSKAAAATGWGTLRGKFVYDGPAPTPAAIDTSKDPKCSAKVVDEQLVVSPEGGLANVVVFCRTKGVKVNPALMSDADGKVVLDNNGCRFVPRVLPFLVTQRLVIKNSDQTSHNTQGTPVGDAQFNPVIAIGGAAEQKFSKVQVIPQKVACNIHPWMGAYILPRDNPYFAVSGPDGSFEIKDLPTGELEFLAWQEKSTAGNYLNVPGWSNGKKKIVIKAGDNDLGVIKLAPDLFKP